MIGGKSAARSITQYATVEAIAHKHSISSNQETNTLDVRPGKKLVLLDSDAQLLSNIDPQLRFHIDSVEARSARRVDSDHNGIRLQPIEQMARKPNSQVNHGSQQGVGSLQAKDHPRPDVPAAYPMTRSETVCSGHSRTRQIVSELQILRSTGHDKPVPKLIVRRQGGLDGQGAIELAS